MAVIEVEDAVAGVDYRVCHALDAERTGEGGEGYGKDLGAYGGG